MRLAAELDREHTQMVMRAQEQWADTGLIAVAGPDGVTIMSWPTASWADSDASAGRSDPAVAITACRMANDQQCPILGAKRERPHAREHSQTRAR